MTSGAPLDLPATMPRRRTDLILAEFETEYVVLVPEARQAHHLDDGLSLVLDSCDGETATADVVEEVAHGTGQSTAAVRRWLLGSVHVLVDLDMLDDATRQTWQDTVAQ